MPFYVHAKLLTNVSPVFRAAFGGGPEGDEEGFLESQTRTMRLPEERPDDFRFLLQWVYWWASQNLHRTGSGSAGQACPDRPSQLLGQEGPSLGAIHALWHAQIDPALVKLAQYHRERRNPINTDTGPRCGGDSSQSVVEITRPRPPGFGPLIRLYVLADKYGIARLRDEICDRVREVAVEGNCVPGREDLWVLCEGVIGGKLRELVLDLYMGMKTGGLIRGETGYGNGDSGGDGEVDWHEGFLRELVVKVLNENQNPNGLDSRGEAKGADDGKVGGGREDFVLVGRLRRCRCAYHEHGP